MSGYATNGRANVMFTQIKHSRRMVCGVCSYLADKSGVPVWLVRAVALVSLLMHCLLVAALYVGAALWLRKHGGDVAREWQAPSPAPAPSPPSWDRDGLTARFSRLDGRLASMERAALDREMGLRRAFRELDPRG